MKTGTLQFEQGFPVMKTGFSLWELANREFPVSYTGFGFAVFEKVWGQILHGGYGYGVYSFNFHQNFSNFF
jgi:hypothetical protein